MYVFVTRRAHRDDRYGRVVNDEWIRTVPRKADATVFDTRDEAQQMLRKARRGNPVGLFLWEIESLST